MKIIATVQYAMQDLHQIQTIVNANNVNLEILDFKDKIVK